MKILFTILVSIPLLLSAQERNFSNKGRFSIDFDRGCVPATIHITEYLPPEQNRNYDYGVQQPRTEDTTFTYTSSGEYQIIQLFAPTASDPDADKYDTLTFTVSNSPTPKFNVFACVNQSLTVEIKDNVYNHYRVYFTETDSVDIDPLKSTVYSYSAQTATVTVKGLFDNSYNEQCGESSEIIQFTNSLLAPSIDTAFFIEDCNGKYDLNITLSALSDAKSRIELKDAGMSSIIYEGRLNANEVFNDIVLSDSRETCIIVSAIDVCSGVSVANEDYCIPFNKKTSQYFRNAYASNSGQSVILYFETAFQDSILIQQNTPSDNVYNTLSQTLPPTYEHRNASRHEQESYKLSVVSNTCSGAVDEVLLSAPFIKLSSKSRLTNDITIQLIEPQNQLEGTPTKELIFYSQDSSTTHLSLFEEQTKLPFNVGEYQNICVKYTYESGEVLFSNKIFTRINYVVHVPTAFTPNSDGLNDVLTIFGLPTSSGSIHIYNRWGEVVYKSNDILLGWNGRVQNSNAPEGTYRYKVHFEIPDGEIRTQVGTFVLIRK